MPPRTGKKGKPAKVGTAAERAALRREPDGAGSEPLPKTIGENRETRMQLHKDRAKRWDAPSAYTAEWFENAVIYCKSPKGQEEFMYWLRCQHSAAEVQQILREMGLPIRKEYGSYYGNAKMINRAAYEFGISDEAMRQYHKFTATNSLVMPPRTLPAVTRNKNEPINDYLARMHESIFLGCKAADIRWKELKHLAISQYDQVRETYEHWHLDMNFYNHVVRERAATTVSITSQMQMLARYPDPREAKMGTKMQLRGDAYRSTMYLMHFSHGFWRTTARLLEDLAMQGLVSSSAIERAYEKDPILKWRLVAAIVLGREYQMLCSVKVSTILAAQPAFQPYLKRTRTDNGQLHLDRNLEYIAAHPFRGDTVDGLVVDMCTQPPGALYGAFNILNEILSKSPQEKHKFSQDCWDELGDLSNICEFTTEFFQSDFGQKLMQRSNEPISHADEKILFDEVCFMDPTKLRREKPLPSGSVAQDFGNGRQLVHDLIHTWFLEIYDSAFTPESKFIQLTSIHDVFGNTERPFVGQSAEGMHVTMIPYYDAMWLMVDDRLWEKAKRLDRPGQAGTVAKMFGLHEPRSNNRRSYLDVYLEERKAKEERSERPAVVETKKPTEYCMPLPVAAPTDKVTLSGHSVVAGKEVKEKIKTRPEDAAVKQTQPELVESEEDYTGTDEFMPTKYKLPRKIWKIFDRLLEDEVPSESTSQKKGQIRWGEFENAMKRINFEVIQTMGSSVRFVPPASSERAISFHRPHPDSVLTPLMIKIVGARLKRRYGWTTSTFQRRETENEEGIKESAN